MIKKRIAPLLHCSIAKKIKPIDYETMEQRNNFLSSRGLTLIELILVMAIIAIITAGLWGNFFSSLSKGRDSKRKQDLESVTKALEFYYSDFKAYPTAMPSWSAPFANPTNTAVIYMQRLPADPAYPNSTYCYVSDASGTYYKLYANLENRSDPKIIPTVSCPVGTANYYNYGISSANTTP